MSVRSTLNGVGLSYARWLCKREFKQQTFNRLNERSVEYGFVFSQFTRFQPRTVLDVGTGQTALPHLLRTCGAVVTAIDNVRDYWSFGMVNRHWHVVDDDIRASRWMGSFEFITCVSVLEHVRDHGAAFAGMLRLLAPGGHLIVTAPYNEQAYCPNVYALPDSEVRHQKPLPYVTQAFSRAEVDGWLAGGARLLEQEHWQFFEGAYWTVGAKLATPRRVGPGELHQHSCLLFEKT